MSAVFLQPLSNRVDSQHHREYVTLHRWPPTLPPVLELSRKPLFPLHEFTHCCWNAVTDLHWDKAKYFVVYTITTSDA